MNLDTETLNLCVEMIFVGTVCRQLKIVSKYNAGNR